MGYLAKLRLSPVRVIGCEPQGCQVLHIAGTLSRKIGLASCKAAGLTGVCQLSDTGFCSMYLELYHATWESSQPTSSLQNAPQRSLLEGLARIKFPASRQT
jgi:hypothetical protein